MTRESSGIGTLNEGSLHAALKEHYAQPGDEFEVPLERFVIDISRPSENLLIEIQTSSFAAMGRKLDRVLDDHRVLLVHPIATGTWLNRDGKKPRKSPKKGSVYSIFDELVSVPTLLDHPNLALDVVLVSVEKIQVEDPKARRGRGGWRTVDRVLREVHDTLRFENVNDLRTLVPELPEEFTTADLAERASVDRETARKMAYCFRPLGVFELLRRERAGYVYRLSC